MIICNFPIVRKTKGPLIKLRGKKIRSRAARQTAMKYMRGHSLCRKGAALSVSLQRGIVYTYIINHVNIHDAHDNYRYQRVTHSPRGFLLLQFSIFFFFLRPKRHVGVILLLTIFEYNKNEPCIYCLPQSNEKQNIIQRLLTALLPLFCRTKTRFYGDPIARELRAPTPSPPAWISKRSVEYNK